jgi:hypothetical protein
MRHGRFMSRRLSSHQHTSTRRARTAHKRLSHTTSIFNGRRLPNRVLCLFRLLSKRVLQSRPRLSDNRKLWATYLHDPQLQRRGRRSTHGSDRRFRGITGIVSKCLVQLRRGPRRKLLSERLRMWRSVHGDCVWTGWRNAESYAEFCIFCFRDFDLDHGFGLFCCWVCYACVMRHDFLMVYDRCLMCLQFDTTMLVFTKIISTLRTYAAHFCVANSYDTPSRHTSTHPCFPRCPRLFALRTGLLLTNATSSSSSSFLVATSLQAGASRLRDHAVGDSRSEGGSEREESEPEDGMRRRGVGVVL